MANEERDEDGELLSDCLDLLKSANKQQQYINALNIQSKELLKRVFKTEKTQLSMAEMEKLLEIERKHSRLNKLTIAGRFHNCSGCSYHSRGRDISYYSPGRCNVPEFYTPFLARFIKIALYNAKTKCPYRKRQMKEPIKKPIIPEPIITEGGNLIYNYSKVKNED